MELSIQKSEVGWLGFSGFFRTLDSLEGSSQLRRGLVVLWGGWGERKREHAFSLFPSSPARFLFFSIIAIFIEIPSGSLCRGESEGRVWLLSQSSLLFHRQLTYLWKHAKKPTKLIDRTWLSAGGGGSAHKNADARMQAINLRSRTTPESAVTIFF